MIAGLALFGLCLKIHMQYTSKQNHDETELVHTSMESEIFSSGSTNLLWSKFRREYLASKHFPVVSLNFEIWRSIVPGMAQKFEKIIGLCQRQSSKFGLKKLMIFLHFQTNDAEDIKITTNEQRQQQKKRIQGRDDVSDVSILSMETNSTPSPQIDELVYL